MNRLYRSVLLLLLFIVWYMGLYIHVFTLYSVRIRHTQRKYTKNIYTIKNLNTIKMRSQI